MLTPEQRKSWLTHLNQACDLVAPVWPLDSFVAVNPYLGLADQPFETAAARLAQAGQIQLTLPVSFYQKALENGEMTLADLAYALKKSGLDMPSEVFLANIAEPKADSAAAPLGVDVATEVSGTAWSDLMVDRISSWAAAYFDEGQALWRSASREQELFAAWRAEALTDRSLDLMGLKGFRQHLRALPAQPEAAALACLQRLALPAPALDLYLHSLLLRVGGWAAYAAKQDWENRLYGGPTRHRLAFLSILLCWETCLLQALPPQQVAKPWQRAKQQLAFLVETQALAPALREKLVLQQAYDHACQRSLREKIDGAPGTAAPTERPAAQAIFCIDVRSEVYRRNLELVAPKVETLGFAGFFAFAVRFLPLGHNQARAQCPVLIPASHTVMETVQDHAKAVRQRGIAYQVSQAWKAFKLGAISCFSFVGPIGLAYLPKLFTDAFGLTRPEPHPEQAGLPARLGQARQVSLDPAEVEGLAVGFSLEEQVSMAQSALQAMSLTEGFARLVLLVGHGSSTVNNPHATGLDCGACGGQSGEANAKVAAAVLNRPAVRAQLAENGLEIPADTCFVAALHDTTTDEVTLFGTEALPESHAAEVEQLRLWLAKAGHTTRTERATRLGIGAGAAVDAAVIARSKDWSQVRPEWGLAGCHAFVVAPRRRTLNLDLGGTSFLHSYEWQQDEGFGVLELIMTAPMVVTSWINLQYYASTVDNRHFGSGNKTLHNVVGGIGVLEGHTGDLRTGLPWQSVHDGTQYQHLPQRLNVIIEAPLEAMNGVLAKHPSVQALCDHGWIHLLAMDDRGRVSHRYLGEQRWEALQQAAVRVEK